MNNFPKLINACNLVDLKVETESGLLFFEGADSDCYTGTPDEWKFAAQHEVLSDFRYGLDGPYTWEAPLSSIDSVIAKIEELVNQRERLTL